MINPDVLKNTLASPETDGLFSLKALCASTGDYEKNKPYEFLRLPATQDYITGKSLVFNELTIRTTQGRGGDTFVSRKLVYRYAMWVSNDFYDMVIDVFDTMLHNQPAQASQIIATYGHQPNHPNSLPALLNIPRAKSEPYFDILRQKNVLTRTFTERKPQAIYHASIAAEGVVIGQKGHTLLFSVQVKDLFPVQQAWT